MTKIELTSRLFNELTDTQLKLLNFNIYYNPEHIDYYVDFQCGEYQKCYDFIMHNIDLLDIKYTPKKWLRQAKNIIKMK